MKRKIISFLIGVFVGTSSIVAQETEVLPIGLTNQEKSLIVDFSFNATRVSPPPSEEVRTSAQWEEVEYLVIRWTNQFSNIQRQIVEAAIQECQVLIVTQNPAAVESYLQSNGIDLTKVEFINAASNSIWIRDYAGNTVYTDDVGERALVEWIYNRPRPDDDDIPIYQASYIGVPLYATVSAPADLVNTGGNFMSDGIGTAFASHLVTMENAAGNPYGVSPKTEADIDQIMAEYMGIDRYIKMDVLPYDGIHHIDMHMKLLDEETLLVSKYPEGVADGPFIQENIDYVLSNFLTPFGNPYTVHWIDAPPSPSGNYPDTGGAYRTYTNAVIINKTILVPTYRPEVDIPALQQLEALMPGYTVVGIDVDNTAENLISLGGAIHCITHTIGVADPLLIVHEKIVETNTTVDIPVDAWIKHISGIQQAKVYWRVSGDENFEEIAMSHVQDDQWSTLLTVPTDAQKIEYYIWAQANTGKSLSRPLVAPEGYWTFTIGTLGISEWASQNITGPYPNPTYDQLSFSLKQIPGPIDIAIYNILGQELYSQQLLHGNGNVTLSLNPEWSGTLLVVFRGEFGTVHKKVLKL